MKTFMNRLIPLAVAACLAGCGGGGGSNAPAAPEAPVKPAPPAPPQNLQSAPLPATMLSPTLSVTLHAANGNTLAVSITAESGSGRDQNYVPPQFEGAYESQVTETLSSTGGTLTAWFFYDEDPYTPIGFAYPAGLLCFYTGWTPPANLTVGESGQLDSISCDNGLIPYTEVQTYEVTAYSPTEVQATLVTEASNGNNVTEVFLVNAAGAVQLVSATIDGVTFTP